MRSGVWYTAAAAVTALAVAVLGGSMVEGAGRAGVWLGAGAGLVVQVATFWVLFVLLFPNQRLLAHGLGMIARFVLVALVALVLVPVLGTPAAPTLFSLVTVLFVTTLVEPVILQIASKTRR